MFSRGRFMVICRMVRSVFSSLYFDSSWIESQSRRRKKNSARTRNRMRIGTSSRQKSVSKQMEISFFFTLSSVVVIIIVCVVSCRLRLAMHGSDLIFFLFTFFSASFIRKTASEKKVRLESFRSFSGNTIMNFQWAWRVDFRVSVRPSEILIFYSFFCVPFPRLLHQHSRFHWLMRILNANREEVGTRWNGSPPARPPSNANSFVLFS